MSGSTAGRLRSVALVVAALAPAAGVAAVPVSGAAAQDAYVLGSEGRVSVIDTQTNQLVGAPIPVESEPDGIAITPDGRFAYVTNIGSDSVSVIDTADNQVFGQPIKVGTDPGGIAITPDGRFAYVADSGSGAVSVIDTATNQAVGPPIEVGSKPRCVAITPDGRFAYVTDSGGEKVWVIDTQENKLVEPPIHVGKSPGDIEISPDGRFAYVANVVGETISVIGIRTNAVIGSPPSAVSEPDAISIMPDGRSAYIAGEAGAVAAFDLEDNQWLGSPLELGMTPFGSALTADGRTLYVADLESREVSVLSTQTNQLGAPIEIGEKATAVAVVPDQPPHATFEVADGRPAVSIPFDASGSSDSDGSIARYDWSFGDGTTLANGGPDPRHSYKKPGDYKVTLTLTDDQGCSTAFVFTGQTAYCAGSPSATQTQAVEVSYPGVRLRCPRKAGRRGCRYRLQAVTKRRGGRAESAVAKSKAKAGRRVVVALRAKPAFAARLARVKWVLVKERSKIGRSTATRTARLKIVR
jgi:YVTN family beta-propeller protein